MSETQPEVMAEIGRQYLARHKKGVLAALASFYQDKPQHRRTRKAVKGVILR